MLNELDFAIRSVCPIDGVSSTGRIDFASEATDEQRTAASRLLKDWDVATKSWLPGTEGAKLEAARLEAEKEARTAAAIATVNSGEPQAKVIRGLARVVMELLIETRNEVNRLEQLLVAKGVIEAADVHVLENRDWHQLVAVWAAVVAKKT